MDRGDVERRRVAEDGASGRRALLEQRLEDREDACKEDTGVSVITSSKHPTTATGGAPGVTFLGGDSEDEVDQATSRLLRFCPALLELDAPDEARDRLPAGDPAEGLFEDDAVGRSSSMSKDKVGRQCREASRRAAVTGEAH